MNEKDVDIEKLNASSRNHVMKRLDEQVKKKSSKTVSSDEKTDRNGDNK